MEEFGWNITEKYISISTRLTHFSRRFICPDAYNESYTIEISEDIYSLDPIEERIIEELKRDCRMQITRLAEKCGVTTTTVLNKIRKLRKNKVLLCFKTNINLPLLGYINYKVFMKFNEFSESSKSQFIKYLAAEPSICYVSQLIGKDDLEFEPIVKSNHEFYRLMNRIRNSFPDLIRSFTYLIRDRKPEIDACTSKDYF